MAETHHHNVKASLTDLDPKIQENHIESVMNKIDQFLGDRPLSLYNLPDVTEECMFTTQGLDLPGQCKKQVLLRALTNKVNGMEDISEDLRNRLLEDVNGLNSRFIDRLSRHVQREFAETLGNSQASSLLCFCLRLCMSKKKPLKCRCGRKNCRLNH